MLELEGDDLRLRVRGLDFINSTDIKADFSAALDFKNI